MGRTIHEVCDNCGDMLPVYVHVAGLAGAYRNPSQDDPLERLKRLGGMWVCDACFWKAAQLLREYIYSMTEREDKLEAAIRTAVGLFEKAHGQREKCDTCGRTAYEHIDHGHVEPCPFGDCGDYKEATHGE